MGRCYPTTLGMVDGWRSVSALQGDGHGTAVITCGWIGTGWTHSPFASERWRRGGRVEAGTSACFYLDFLDVDDRTITTHDETEPLLR